MVTLCWAAKGGSGTTVLVSALALESERPALVVDLAGEIPTVLGLATPHRPGVLDWLASTGPADQLADLVLDVDDTTFLVPSRSAGPGRPVRVVDAGSPRTDRAGSPVERPAERPAVPGERWAELVRWCVDWEHRRDGEVWIDAGSDTPSPTLADRCDHRWLVTRSCYLALRRGADAAVRPDGVLLVTEPWRQLRTVDVERSIGAPVVATIPIDPLVARSVDAGFLTSRPPSTIRRSLRALPA